MKVLHISLFDRVGGGCIAGYRQHTALRQAGVDSQMFVRFKVTGDPFVHDHSPPAEWSLRLPRVWRRKAREWKRRHARLKGEFFLDSSEHGKNLLDFMPKVDLVNVQFAWDFLDYPSFFTLLPKHVPIVVTMHEMGAFTGGCSYAESCTRFLNDCGYCPKLGRSGENDLSRSGWIQRRNAYAARNKSNLHFVAVSNWLLDDARKSGILKNHACSLIYNGLNTNVFRPFDKIVARQALNIPTDIKVLSFAAAAVNDTRKGLKYLLSAIEGMDKPPFILTWGKNCPAGIERYPNMHLGSIESEQLMSIAYNASDILAVPSLQENLPQTATESIACGTPVVAFSAGGIPEVVRDGETGLLCPVGDANALGSNIKRLLEDEALWRHCSKNGPKVAQAEFSYEANAKHYIALYRSLLENVAKK
jgi:glycosyltransferase involved in cell wall biosynthesis